jgi:predicted kinase
MTEIKNKQVIIPRGIPGSGKTTWVKNQMAAYPVGTVVRISNDDLAYAAFGKDAGVVSFTLESGKILEKMRLSLLETYLNIDFVSHIYIDNTNLSVKTVHSLERLASRLGADVVVNDDFLGVEASECVRRDALRSYPVGKEVIISMSNKAAKLKPWKNLVKPNIIKVDNTSKDESCIIVDFDGTLAHMVDRGPYEWLRVGEDALDKSVYNLMKNYYGTGVKIVIISGRDGSALEGSIDWLTRNEVPYDEIHMCVEGDYRPDWIVKHELYQEHIADRYNVLFVLDDRNQVVDLWRKMGLPTWQVAEGDF